MSQPIKKKNKKLLAFSVFISLILHAGQIHLLQRHAFWFSQTENSANPVDGWALKMEKREKNQILKETFHALSYAKKEGVPEKFSSVQTTFEVALFSPHPEPQFSSLPKMDVVFPKSIICAKTKLPSLSIDLEKPPLPNLPKKDLQRSSPLDEKETINPATCALNASNKLPREKISQEAPTFSLAKLPSFSKDKTLCFSPPTIGSSTPILKIPSLLEIQTTSYSSFFDTEILFLEEEPGSYLFALTLIPKENLKIESLKQNYVFLIDRANSIQKERLIATKQAVKKAVEELNTNDHFNILVFDQKVEKLFPSSNFATAQNVEKAQNFLNEIELGSFFSQKNLYKPLFLTVPFTQNQNELYTAILFTDGENLSQKSHLMSLAHDWTRLNQGKVSLYTLGMNEDLHANELETITHLNRGKSLFSPTNRGIKRKLLKLMKSISSPLAKNLSCKAVPIYETTSPTIELFPSNKNAPHLFLNEPYVILGKTDSLDDFVLFVQGKVADKWLHIKKNISFSNAKKAPASLAAQWAQSKSNSLYQKYLEGNGPEFLVEARELSHAYDLNGVFE